jgi:DNA repair protein RecN (Recombination protein N)
MLTTLRIKNLALVPELTLELAAGYNVISGETGAGKSVIMGALNLVLGERADRTLIRAGAESCSVEAVFKVERVAQRVNAILDEKGLDRCEENHLVLKRVFTASGTNKQFINGSPSTLAGMAEVGVWLVDMHGPHEHQSLLNASNQLRILDAFGRLESLKKQFGERLQIRRKLLSEKASLIVDERTYAQQLDLLRFQVREIASAKLVADEDQQLETEYDRLSNASKLIELAQNALNIISENEDSLLTQAGAAGRAIQELSRIDPAAEDIAALQKTCAANLQELQREIGKYADRIQLDPARLRELEQRLDLIQGLKRKYGSTARDVIQFGNEALIKLQALESRDEELERIQNELRANEERLWKIGQELSESRKKVVPKLTRAVMKELSDLGFRQSEFGVKLESATRGEAFAATVREDGFDTVEFQFAPNPGEPARPLKAIVSSGELARVMLALKTVLATEDEIPVLVFDEVDANVGGETARAVGEKMRQIGAQRQVLCITHLAPVAAAANSHYVVKKELAGGRSLSRIHQVSGKDRIEEVARMLGGGEAARKHAAAMVGQARA